MKGEIKRKWQEFPLNKLFSVGAGKRLETRNKISGNRPFIGATDNRNGVTGFVGNDNNSKDKNVLGVNYNGAPCLAFYHPYECVFTDDVKRLHLKKYSDGRDVLLYLATVIQQQRTKYSYGYKFNETRMQRQKLMLPVDNIGEPDFNYMTLCSAKTRRGMLIRYKKYIEQQLSHLEYKKIMSLANKEWKPVVITRIFKLVRGRECNMAALSEGQLPLVSAKAYNNGLKGFISTATKIMPGHCISLNNDGDGGAGLAYYQPANMALDTHVTALIPLKPMSRETMLFISVCISGLHGFFGHGLSISKKRTGKISIMLPVDDNGRPDYGYMEQYATNMILYKYKQYLAFLATHSET